MKVIRKLPGQPPEVTDIDNTGNALRKALGGKIEAVTLADGLVVLRDEEWRFKEKPRNCSIAGVEFGGTILVVGAEGEDFCDLQNLDAVLWVLFRTIRYTRADRANNVWKCRRCDHMERFEADGPYENGWNLCPHCGGFILVPDRHGKTH